MKTQSPPDVTNGPETPNGDSVQQDGSATVEKPHKVHVWVCGHYCGTYDFATADEADSDYEYRKRFEVLGFRYQRESPNDDQAQRPALGGK